MYLGLKEITGVDSILNTESIVAISIVKMDKDKKPIKENNIIPAYYAVQILTSIAGVVFNVLFEDKQSALEFRESITKGDVKPCKTQKTD